MAKIYALSDIHGCLAALKQSLDLIDLKKEDQILFLGDYVDRGNQSCQVLQTLMALDEKYAGQVTILLGNHDEWFCDWLFSPKTKKSYLNYFFDFGLDTVESFFEAAEFQAILNSHFNAPTIHARLQLIEASLHEALLKNPKHQKLLSWLKAKQALPRYIETDEQIFVHAGVDETAGKNWQKMTKPEIYIGKYPATTGNFYKTIVCGHFHSDMVAADEKYLGRIYYDQASHYFIDGFAVKSGQVPVLIYDTQTKQYSSLEKIEDTWQEYTLNGSLSTSAVDN